LLSQDFPYLFRCGKHGFSRAGSDARKAAIRGAGVSREIENFAEIKKNRAVKTWQGSRGGCDSPWVLKMSLLHGPGSGNRGQASRNRSFWVGQRAGRDT